MGSVWERFTCGRITNMSTCVALISTVRSISFSSRTSQVPFRMFRGSELVYISQAEATALFVHKQTNTLLRHQPGFCFTLFGLFWTYSFFSEFSKWFWLCERDNAAANDLVFIKLTFCWGLCFVLGLRFWGNHLFNIFRYMLNFCIQEKADKSFNVFAWIIFQPVFWFFVKTNTFHDDFRG